jgi:hypothetical protein
MCYKAKGAVCSEICTKRINAASALPRIFECYSWWYVKLPLGLKRLTEKAQQTLVTTPIPNSCPEKLF